MADNTNITNAFQEALLTSNKETAENMLVEFLKQGSPLLFVEEVLVKVLDNIGNGWGSGDYALSQVYIAGRICEDLLDIYLPDDSNQRKNKPKMSIAILNDYHTLGKRIVYSTLRASGYQLQDYGRVEAEDLVERIIKDQVELVLISVLMFSSALEVKKVVNSLAGYGSDVKIAVGGAPFRFDHRLWKEVGADAVGYTASDALHIAKSFAGGPQ